MGTTQSAPPFDRELGPALAMVPDTPLAVSELVSRRVPSPDPDLDALGLVREDRGDLSIFRSAKPGPCFYFAHPGGMVMGDRLRGIGTAFALVERFGGSVVTVEYRLAPEHPDPAPVEDVASGLRRTVADARDAGTGGGTPVIGIGVSAGGGLLAGATLMARDRGEPMPDALLLLSPMLDDRNDTPSAVQLDGRGLWDRASNEVGWRALLGDRYGSDQVSAYTAPARARNLHGLPPVYLETGSAETFRDEVVAFAQSVWAGGGVADLHVWAGACHGFDLIAPQAAVSRAARAARAGFVERILA